MLQRILFRRVYITVVLAWCLWLTIGCTQHPSITATDVLEQLRAREMQPISLGTAYAPLTIRGQHVEVRGTATAAPTSLQIYDVAGQQVTIEDGTITTVSSDGPATVDVRPWHVPLVVFRQGDVLVLCFGRDERVIHALTDILGSSVAQSKI